MDIRKGNCVSRADTEPLTALRANACVQNLDSALYTNPTRTVVVIAAHRDEDPGADEHGCQ